MPMESDNDECNSFGTAKEISCNSQALRPRRNVIQKNVEYNNGLHWIEEKDLKKALYASLQESKKFKSDIEVDTSVSIAMAGLGQNRKRKNDSSANGEDTEENGKKSKVHAQRKFAQGSNPTSPTVTPIKLKSSLAASVDFPPMKRPKTEDFLTFLCLRGTPVLPTSLTYFSVAAKNDANGDSRCQSPIIGDTAEKLKSHSKINNTVIKAFGKLSKPNSYNQMKTRLANKKTTNHRIHSSSESSISDSENDLSKSRQSIQNAANKKQGRGSSGFQNKIALMPSKSINNLKQTTSVQALKQKYRQQRLAKEKEVLNRTKKSDNSPKKEFSSPCKVNNDVKLVIDKWPTNALPTVNVSSLPVNVKEKANSIRSDNIISTASKKIIAVKSVKNEESARKPITRHAAVLLQAARDKAERESAKVDNNKTLKVSTKVVPSEEIKPKLTSEFTDDKKCDYEKHLPLLESEHSYVKRLPIVNSGPSKLKPSVCVKQSSDFSSSDDEPLVKKKNRVSKLPQRQTAIKNDTPDKDKQNKKLLSGTAYQTRSSKYSDSQQSYEIASKLPLSSRPTRKTKEAASVYLELLGQRLNSCDDDYEIPPKPNSRLKCDYKKQLFITPTKQKPLRWKDKDITVSTKSAAVLDTSTSSSSSSSSSSAVNNSSSCSTSSTSTTSTSPSSSTSPPSEMADKMGCRNMRTIKKWPVGKPTSVVQCLTTPLERIDVVKTRDFMRKLSDARFNLARDQTEKICSNKVIHYKQPNVIYHRNEEVKYTQKTNLMKIPERKAGPSKFVSAQGKPQPRFSKSKINDHQMLNSRSLKLPEKKIKNKVAKKTFTIGPKSGTLGPSHSLHSTRVCLNKSGVGKHANDDSSSSDSSSFSPPLPPKVVTYKRGPGRVPAMHALRHIPIPDIPDSTSTESSEEEDMPSKPEATTISVRQNVTSNSVAVQVNLLNDISDFEDDCWEPGFLDSGIEGLFSMERTGTPVFPKNSPQNRLSWEGENTSPGGKSLICKSREHTPTKIKSEGMECQAGVSSCRLSNSPKRVSKCHTSSSSSPSPVIQKEFKRPVTERAIQIESSSDDDSSEFNIAMGTLSGVKEAPIFYPSEKEFQDPLGYIEKIRSQAERFGICKIVPPSSFKPECKLINEMRFTGHNQYIHKMFHRFGPNVQEMKVIKKHLEVQKIDFDSPPLIGGMEVDLPRLYHTVQQYGGLKEVIEKKKWQKVADSMKIAKSALDKVNKLYDAYCKYLLPYDTLSKQEKLDIDSKVRTERKRGRFSEIDDCVTKGRSMSLSSFCRIARNTLSMWSKNDAKPSDVEHEYWRIVNQRRCHLCVHAGSIDSSTFGYGFSSNKASTFGRHPWNLKVLTNDTKSILRCMGPLMGLTIPIVHLGMVFSTGCWYRDPHCLPWIEYLHTGSSKIWYSVPASQSCKFRDAMRKIVPDFCTNNPIWLPSDTAMVPPDLLVENGVSLYRLVQNSGQFVVVFPRVFTSTICCGYNISESVYFAGSDWLEIAPIAFKEMSDSCEPAVFSLQRLLIGIAKDSRISIDALNQVYPLLKEMRDNEIEMRKLLFNMGLKQTRHVTHFELKNSKNRQPKNLENQIDECDICRTICFISLVFNKQENVVYCLRHAVEHLQKKKKDLKFCEIMYTLETAELDELIKQTNAQLQTRNATKRGKKFIGKKGS